MSNTEPTVTLPAEPVFEGNTITFEVAGNPNILERIHVTENIGETEIFTYGYVDPTTNTFIHSHQMQRKNGSFL